MWGKLPTIPLPYHTLQGVSQGFLPFLPAHATQCPGSISLSLPGAELNPQSQVYGLCNKAANIPEEPGVVRQTKQVRLSGSQDLGVEWVEATLR